MTMFSIERGAYRRRRAIALLDTVPMRSATTSSLLAGAEPDASRSLPLALATSVTETMKSWVCR